MTHPDLGDAEAQHLLQMQIERARPSPPYAPRFVILPVAVAVDPRFVEVTVRVKSLPVQRGQRMVMVERACASLEWRSDAHGGVAHDADDPIAALELLAGRTASTRAPWQAEGVAVDVIVRDQVRGRTATGTGQTVGAAIDDAIDRLRGEP